MSWIPEPGDWVVERLGDPARWGRVSRVTVNSVYWHGFCARDVDGADVR